MPKGSEYVVALWGIELSVETHCLVIWNDVFPADLPSV